MVYEKLKKAGYENVSRQYFTVRNKDYPYVLWFVRDVHSILINFPMCISDWLL